MKRLLSLASAIAFAAMLTGLSGCGEHKPATPPSGADTSNTGAPPNVELGEPAGAKANETPQTNP